MFQSSQLPIRRFRNRQEIRHILKRHLAISRHKPEADFLPSCFASLKRWGTISPTCSATSRGLLSNKSKWPRKLLHLNWQTEFGSKAITAAISSLSCACLSAQKCAEDRASGSIIFTDWVVPSDPRTTAATLTTPLGKARFFQKVPIECSRN